MSKNKKHMRLDTNLPESNNSFSGTNDASSQHQEILLDFSITGEPSLSPRKKNRSVAGPMNITNNEK
jgi:hypothetical protein